MSVLKKCQFFLLSIILIQLYYELKILIYKNEEGKKQTNTTSLNYICYNFHSDVVMKSDR